MNLCVLSCCYEHPERASLLMESCAHFGLPLLMCGEIGSPWPGSFRIGKLIAARDTIKSIRKSFGHVLWTDGFDSIAVAGEAKIMQRFESFGRPLVFSVETNCYPDPDMIPRYPENPFGGDCRYLNAGGWMGEVDYLLAAIEAALDHTPQPAPCRDSDQYIWSRAFLDRIVLEAVLDYQPSIFRTMWRHRTLDCLSESEIGDVCIVHYNGAVHTDGYVKMAALWEKVKRTGGTL
jgi:hypothetical protein